MRLDEIRLRVKAGLNSLDNPRSKPDDLSLVYSSESQEVVCGRFASLDDAKNTIDEALLTELSQVRVAMIVSLHRGGDSEAGRHTQRQQDEEVFHEA